MRAGAAKLGRPKRVWPHVSRLQPVAVGLASSTGPAIAFASVCMTGAGIRPVNRHTVDVVHREFVSEDVTTLRMALIPRTGHFVVLARGRAVRSDHSGC